MPRRKQFVFQLAETESRECLRCSVVTAAALTLPSVSRSQVWNEKKVWEGFIKCCQRTKPSSYQVLLQLPAEPLKDVFETAPELRPQLRSYVNNFTAAQRDHIPADVLELITGHAARTLEDEPVRGAGGEGGRGQRDHIPADVLELITGHAARTLEDEPVRGAGEREGGGRGTTSRPTCWS